MKKVTKDKVVLEMSKDNEVVEYIEPNEKFIVETNDCFSGVLKTEEDFFSDVGWDKINPATGPIYIKGSEPGDVLIVNIENIKVAEQGVMTVQPGDVMGDEIKSESTSIIKIRDDKILFDKKLYLPVKPMIGVIGTAPKGEAIRCSTPGLHGGNMDCKEITNGSKVYLPVNTSGALLAMGDVHALMADGELAETGVEVAANITMSCDVKKSEEELPLPMVSTKDKLIIIHSDNDVKEAINKVTYKSVKFISKKTSMPLEKALRLIGLVGQASICQIVNPLMTAKTEIPWSVLNKLGIEESNL